MALLAIFKGEGFTKEMYEALRPVVKWEKNPSAGAMIHACGFDPDGNLHVADVWASEEQMNEFVGTRLIPGFQQIGIPMPNVEVFPLHNLNVFSGAAGYTM